MAALSPPQVLGFLLASHAVIGNDALQTLGTFLAANRGRIPRTLQATFLCLVLCGVLLLGWSRSGGDPTWGRLQEFAPPLHFGWADLLPPLAVVALTQWGAPVSTSFLVLTAFAPASLRALLLQSLAGYGAAFGVGMLSYGSVAWLLEREGSGAPGGDGEPARHDPPSRPLWLGVQWAATGWLWAQWLVQDLANIYVYLPRRLTAAEMGASLVALCGAVALLTIREGGPIQRLLSSKTHSGNPRSSALLSLLYGLVLFGFARFTTFPLSTTWVFLGLIAGREVALLWRLGERPAGAVAADLAGNLLKAGVGLAVSVVLALGVSSFGPAR